MMEFWRPFLITLGAGLATTLGAAAVFFIKPDDDKKFSTFLSLSAGVMVYLCFVEMMPEAVEGYTKHLGGGEESEKEAKNWVTLYFFAAVAACFLADRIGLWWVARKPENIEKGVVENNPISMQQKSDEKEEKSQIRKNMEISSQISEHLSDLETGTPRTPPKSTRDKSLITMALFSAIAITIHNFPEGVSTFISNSRRNSFGPAMAVAIGLHNIPEGIAVALPVLKATGCKWKAFILATLSGFAQPIAAIVAWAVLKDKMQSVLEAIIYSLIAGMMVYIAILKLYPCAMEFNQDKAGVYFLIGMASMGASLALFRLAS